MHRGQHALLPLRGIGGEQVEQRCGKSRMADFGNRFRIAARKDIALQLWAIHQPVRCFPDRFEPPQPIGERSRHLLGARPVGGCRLGQQQPRFQECEPSRHDEIVGGEFETDLSCHFDELEILIGQGQNGNLGEIDLLLPRQRQQQVERAFIAFDIDDQRRLVADDFSGPAGLE